MGVRRFPTLPYAHKPGVATYLNAWSWEFAAGVPEVIWSGTFYPEPEAPAYVADLVDAGVEIFKLHLQVGEFHLDDPLLDRVWGVLEDAGDAGRPARRVRAGRQRLHRPGSTMRVLRSTRGCALVLAHMGAPGGARSSWPWPSPTTTCGWTPRWCSPTSSRLPARAAAAAGRPGDKILLGTDFPTIPYPYAHQLESLARLDLGDDWLRAVCWENGAQLFGVD